MNHKPKKYLFIDESGDAAFYVNNKKLLIGQEGFKPVLLMGMIELENKEETYNFINDFQQPPVVGQ